MSQPRTFILLGALALSTAVLVPRLAAQAGADIVLWPGQSAAVAGSWTIVSDASAAGGAAVQHPNAGAAKITQALAQPVHYFDLAFDAEAGIPYRLWLRGRAQGNYWGNDSVFVQFTGSVDGAGAAKYRTGTSSALEVNLEECSGCGLSGWGWQDTGWGVGVLGPEVAFATAGPQQMRVQTREDGLTIDQIVLSPQRYLSSAPGPAKNDATILPREGAAPAVTIVRRPYLQQMTGKRVVVVFATREAGEPRVQLTAPSARTVTGGSRLVPASASGLGYGYYHHEVPIDGLTPGTAYAYEATLGAAPVASASFRTAPATGEGAFTFIAFGDSGTGSSEQRQLASVMAGDTFDMAILPGDIAYGNAGGTGDASYRGYNDWFFDIYPAWLRSAALFTAQGNHDSRPSNGNGAAYLDTFTLPGNGASPAYPDHAERYYSFDYGPVHFVALDTEFAFQDLTRRAEQLSWLEADLASTTQPWKIAVYHRSPYSAGGEHGSDLAVRSAFAPLFEQYGVQLSISAHEHDYERSMPLRASSSGTAVTYVVSGGGGAPLYPASSDTWTAFSATRHHYLRTDVTTCTLSLQAIGLDGAAFDSARIDRCQSPPPPPPPPAQTDVVLYAAEAPVRQGAWVEVADSSAAGGRRLRHPNAGAAKRVNPLAQPADYFELTFDAQAGVPYHLWIRGKADSDYWGNDSAFVQFDGSVDAAGTAQFRIGTTSATTFNLEECSGCGLSAWGWEDNGWGPGVFGPDIYFAQSGPQRLRIQTREDGLSIDQVVLSPDRYRGQSPGAPKNDSTILIKP
jgi:hypothetical protein